MTQDTTENTIKSNGPNTWSGHTNNGTQAFAIADSTDNLNEEAHNHNNPKSAKIQGKVAIWLTLLIKIYQKTISPLFAPSCRFYPSCSEYASTCLSEYELSSAIYKSCWRIARCNPFNPGGVDKP